MDQVLFLIYFVDEKIGEGIKYFVQNYIVDKLESQDLNLEIDF